MICTAECENTNRPADKRVTYSNIPDSKQNLFMHSHIDFPGTQCYHLNNDETEVQY